LYALIREADPRQNVILTLESPIERIIKGVAHSQVGGDKYTLTKGLRAMVRHDPDIILVGEVRDFETADAAIQASLTGHLVFTTLHARTDFDAIKRLTGLVGRDASKDYLLTMSMTLNCLWAQRLAAKLCMDCRVAEGDGRKQFAEALGYSLDEFKTLVPEPFPVYRSSGGFLPNHDKCFKCNGYGERGMQVISQILPMTPDVRELIASGESNETRYLGVARRAGMLTFPELAALYVRDGTISLEEASGIAPFWEMRERKDLIVQMLNSYRSDWKEVAENPFILK
jgi:type II secretory ATPase GspE/PulE/Tfp pilus assembly ATPase PilB-like protein